MDERRTAPRRRALRRGRPATARLPHRADRQGALRAVHGSVRTLHRELGGAVGRGDAAQPLGRRHDRTAPRLRAPRVRDPWRGRHAALRPMDHGESPRSDRDVLLGDRRVVQRERGRWWRYRRPAGEGQPDPARLVPHRLGRRSHDRVARFGRGRRRLVLLDELPRPAPSVGPARVGDGPRRLARGAVAGRIPDRPCRARTHPRRQTPALAPLVRRHAGVELRGPEILGTGDAHREPGA